MKTFFTDESGAVTLDWVVLAAALALLPTTIVSQLSGGVDDLTTEIVGSITPE